VYVCASEADHAAEIRRRVPPCLLASAGRACHGAYAIFPPLLARPHAPTTSTLHALAATHIYACLHIRTTMHTQPPLHHCHPPQVEESHYTAALNGPFTDVGSAVIAYLASLFFSPSALPRTPSTHTEHPHL